MLVHTHTKSSPLASSFFGVRNVCVGCVLCPWLVNCLIVHKHSGIVRIASVFTHWRRHNWYKKIQQLKCGTPSNTHTHIHLHTHTTQPITRTHLHLIAVASCVVSSGRGGLPWIVHVCVCRFTFVHHVLAWRVQGERWIWFWGGGGTGLLLGVIGQWLLNAEINRVVAWDREAKSVRRDETIMGTNANTCTQTHR